jgi:HEAT repeat protein
MTRLLGLRPGEDLTVGLALSTAFASSAGLMIAQNGIDALFFDRYGVGKLPVMYLFLGGLMFAISLGIGVLLARLGRGRAFLLIPGAIGLLALAGRGGLLTGAGWVYPALWLLGGAAQFIMGLAVWGLAGLVTDTRQAKRFFPIIAAGSVLGQVVGGLITQPLAAWLGADNLILVWAGTIALVVALATRLVRRGGERPPAGRPIPRQRAAAGWVVPLEEVHRGFRSVRRSMLMRWMAVGAVMFSLLFFSLYLPFSQAATARFDNADDLAGFFGIFYGVSTGLALLVSLFVTNRLLARFGVPVVLLVLPLLYLAAFGTLTVHASFLILAVFRFAQIVWMQGGAGSASEAVINTVPADRRDQTRVFLYGGPTQAGTVIAGVIGLIGEHAVSPTALYAIGLVSAVLAVIAMAGARRAYPMELVRTLREGRPNVFGAVPGGGDAFGLAGSDSAAFTVVLAGLSDPDPRIRRLSAHLLADLKADPDRARGSLTLALRDPDAGVRGAALRSLARMGATGAWLQVTGLVHDREPEVRLAALEALDALAGADGRAQEELRQLLRDSDPPIRARAAAIVLGRGPDDTAERVLRTLAGASEDAVRAAAFAALGASRAPDAFDLASSGLRDPVAPVRAAAARAVAAINPARALPPLLDAMADGDAGVRDAVAAAVARIGRAATPAVVRSLFEPALERGALAALERLPLGELTDEVRRFAAASVAKAVSDHRTANTIDGTSDERRQLLRDSLLARSQREAVTALRTAGLLGNRGSISLALESISMADPAQRANALEIIDTVGDPELVRPLLSLWEDTAEATSEVGWLDRLRVDPDEWIRMCADLVAAAPKGAPMARGPQILSPMERVMFLRRVPLFADLPPEDLKPLASVAEEQDFADEEVIAEQGDIGDAMDIIVEGTVSVRVRGPDRQGRTVAVRSQGDVIGEMAVITSQPRMARLVAAGPVRVLTIDQRHFQSILRERPETSLAIMRMLCQRLAERDADPT